jgi:DNA-binding IclR family transcriptional regulator
MVYLKNEQLAGHTKQTLTTMEEILRDLEEIRETGYALNRGEYMHGRAGLAAPIWGPGKTLEGALVIAEKADEILGDRLNMLTNELLHTCSQISESMGFSPEDFSTTKGAGAEKINSI